MNPAEPDEASPGRTTGDGAPAAPASGAGTHSRDPANDRATFLIAMYKAMWDNINRHILVVWQSITALFAALGAAYLAGRGSMNADLVATLVVLAAGWSIAHTVDARGWFNRNLHIITNIERLFLFDTDERDVHYFFRRPHRKGTIEHLMIETMLGWCIAVVVLLWHFLTRV